jgi:transposase-like protein
MRMQKYSKDIRESYIQDWKTSGKSVLSFCADKAINKNTFQYWLKREKRDKGKRFVEISNKARNMLFEKGISVEAGKIKITLPSGNSKEELEMVIKMLWTLVC